MPIKYLTFSLAFFMLISTCVVNSGTSQLGFSTIGSNLLYGNGIEVHTNGNNILLPESNEIALNDNSATAYYKLGKIYLSKFNEANKAKKAFTKAIELDPSFAEAYSALAWAYLDMNGFKTVIIGIARASISIEDAEKASIFFQTATELKPNLAEVHYGLGIAYSCLDQWNKARGSFEKSVALDPNLSDAWRQLSYIYVSLNKTELALDARKRAIYIDRNNYGTLSNELKSSFIWGDRLVLYRDLMELGSLYIKLAQFAKAIEAYGEAAALSPDDNVYTVLAHKALGKAYNANGDKESAINQHQIILNLGGLSTYDSEKAFVKSLADDLLDEIVSTPSLSSRDRR